MPKKRPSRSLVCKGTVRQLQLQNEGTARKMTSTRVQGRVIYMCERQGEKLLRVGMMVVPPEGDV